MGKDRNQPTTDKKWNKDLQLSSIEDSIEIVNPMTHQGKDFEANIELAMKYQKTKVHCESDI